LPSHHAEWNALAWTYLQSGQSELALDAARRAHEANRANLDYLNTLGVAYGEVGELERAESSFRKALKRKPVFLDALINLAKTLEKQERFAESVPLYERASLSKAIPPAELGAALRGWRGTVVLLQRGARPGEVARFAAALAGPCHDLSALGDDLPALLSVLAAVDDYVSVSNTNVHLVAGLGRTARVLVPFPAEWRWMRRDGPSPWFPRFPVYRQAQSRDWSAALRQLRADLPHV
jgi:tetratricopeptide (TPR) repeat protein